ncbi:MAG: cytoplasmic protein [bacterium]|nr:cytoplasmic protein [bacterium]
MPTRFVSEAIQLVPGALDSGPMQRGEPAMPTRFVWRGHEYAVDRVITSWRETGPCTHGSGEQYTRKHWYRVATTDGAEMKIYFERKARSKREMKTRWWLHSVIEAEVGEEESP